MVIWSPADGTDPLKLRPLSFGNSSDIFLISTARPPVLFIRVTKERAEGVSAKSSHVKHCARLQ